MSSEAGPSRTTAARPAVGSALAAAPAPAAATDAGMASDSDSDSDDDDEMVLDDAPPPSGLLPTAPVPSALDPTLPAFTPLSASQLVLDRKDEFRRVTIPLHRITPLKKEWAQIYAPLVEMVHLQVRFNMKRKCVELKVRPTGGGRARRRASEYRRATSEAWIPQPDVDVELTLLPHTLQTSKHTQDVGQIQKAADFIKAFALGFEVAVRPDRLR